ncbi:uncharacterized protein [Panulirus ornatus]|uniref:uncharacterized protein isoform X2 n=1 Tax=Panulirus ornatus TaxID=150431 RepID=UPI003A859F9D
MCLKSYVISVPRHISCAFVLLSPILLVLWTPIQLYPPRLYMPASQHFTGNESPATSRVHSSASAYVRFPMPTSPEEVKVASLSPLKLNTSLSGKSLEALHGLLDDLMTIMTQTTLKCRKMIRQGGRSCKKIPDGDKKVCLDSFVSALNNCYIYSFGVGRDLSFDAEMGKFGCHVFAFDDDIYHEDLGRNPYPRVHFIHLRIGSDEVVRLVSGIHTDLNITYQYLYRPLDNIMYLLHQYQANIDLLKIDIDGPEFEVLEQSLFKTTILQHTRQLAIEVHLSEFLNPHIDTGPALVHTLTNYLRYGQ